jgi:hypothetical protein
VNRPLMNRPLRIVAVSLLALAAWQIAAPASLAQSPPPLLPPPPQPVAPVAPLPAEPTAGPAAALTTPAMSGPLAANPNPVTIDTGQFGNLYVTGALTGMARFQTNPVTADGDRHARLDLTSGLASLQKNEGVLQFFVQAGGYSFPALGVPHVRFDRTTGNMFGPVPVAYATIAPTDALSIQIGKLPTLIGAEYGFTFQNMNIERGLLWGQEPLISRGIQGNYTAGPLSLSVSWNDGFYSNSYNWMSGLASYEIDPANTIAVAGGGNFGRSPKSTFVTPLAQNNSRIVNLIYTYNAAPFIVTPYFQYTHVPGNAALGITSASTYGGAILANYSVTENINVAGRAEYITTSGSGDLLYGPGSSAASFTLTPTWQSGIFFARGEASVVRAFNTPGAFGRSGTAKTQARWLLEAGVIF